MLFVEVGGVFVGSLTLCRGPPCSHQPLPWIKFLPYKLPGCKNPLVVQGFSNFFRLVSRDDKANPVC